MDNPPDFWPHCGFDELECDSRGWLVPTSGYVRWLLARPELALVPESCEAEVALHQNLQAQPLREVPDAELAAVADADARENFAVFLRFRDTLLAAGTLEACYLQLMREGVNGIPSVFIDALVQAVLRQMLTDGADAFQVRAAEMLFRTQRVALHEGRMLAGDRDTLDLIKETAGLGQVGRLLLQSGSIQPRSDMPVLGPETVGRFWREGHRHRFLLDLTHALTQDLSHGLVLNLTLAHSGLKALAQVLALWVQHFLGVQVQIEPVQAINDPAWRWHVGLDVESTALLNDLYQNNDVDSERLRRLVSLFTLRFADPADMRADVAGKPVYLGLATDANGLVRVKPQNLLLNLPLATRV